MGNEQNILRPMFKVDSGNTKHVKYISGLDMKINVIHIKSIQGSSLLSSRQKKFEDIFAIGVYKKSYRFVDNHLDCRFGIVL